MIRTKKYNYSVYVCGFERVELLGISFKNSNSVELGISFKMVNCVWVGYIQSDCEWVLGLVIHSSVFVCVYIHILREWVSYIVCVMVIGVWFGC